MKNVDIIEKMKKNMAKFRCLSKDEEQCLEKTGKENCEILCADGCWVPATDGRFNPNFRYRLKESYQPEPEIPVVEGYMLYPITIAKITGDLIFSSCKWIITSAPKDPSFAGYGYKLRGVEPIQVVSDIVIYANEYETDWDFVMCDDFNKPLRPSYVVFKEGK